MHQSVLITGASSGIGEATAIHLAHKGFRVFATARREEKLKNLSGLGGGRITPIEMDVTDESSIEKALKKIADEGVTLYGLVNNAGVSAMGPLERLSQTEWRGVFETNVFGLVAVTQALLPQMREAGRGRIVNIGSLTGRIASPFQSAYAATKHAVEGLSDSLRRELKPHGIKVSVVRPGAINTPFGHFEQEMLTHYETDDVYGEQVKIFKAWFEKQHPSAPPPIVVAEAVHEALTAERPQSRYTAPKSMTYAIALRNFLPSGATDRILERINGLDSFKKSRRN
ncbi:SDR family oxidoreductase [Hyphococcus flavus]|uniref:SDR family oxidoreductase n=1 Tax=Hyphococcus flavus TaxID=1866326 RepID=A0AAF0CEA2_9PROT|nr:SDR family oxidoreductase [Hyphococcus flavus]WDI30956.1 SDR family oxidoreductase [Hyphococcus flavus]